MNGATAKVKESTVVILEDEPSVAKRLVEKLQELGHIRSETATNMKSFIEIIKEQQVEAASIDWELHGAWSGNEALDAMAEYQPEAAKIVYTKHDVKGEALSSGADAVQRKQANLDPYGGLMQQGIRLGFARQIVKNLHALKVSGLPDVSNDETELVDRELENMICNKALQAAGELVIAESDPPNHDELTQLLRRRGWWEAFDSAIYIRLSQRAKLGYLLDHANARADDLASILEVDFRSAEAVLKGDEGSDSVLLSESEDVLLSILAFVLRLTGYNPPLMEKYWSVHGLYDRSSSKPPWDSQGLRKYLIRHGRCGLMDSLEWIRSNQMYDIR
jgi:CheY-like chemotaxis protein